MKYKIFTCYVIASVLLLSVVYAYAPPPPPPPPCPIKQLGCYDQEDIKKTPGSMPPNEFGYFITQNACIPGGCRCSVSKFVDDARQLDADESAGACGCVQGTAWAEIEGGNGCCGNEESDCGVILEEERFEQVIENHLCAMDSDLVGSWVPANPNSGDIAFLGCNDKEYVSDGSTWLPCDGFEIKSISNHEYMCTGAGGEESWIECCGSSACNSANGGKRLTSGNSVTVGSLTYYCTSEGTFSQNLDGLDKSSCEGAEFDWTGSLCCSEADDNNEYYNDPEGKGGCWNKETVFTGDVATANPSIANFEGFFFGCQLESSEEGINLLELKDSHTDEVLVQNQPFCYQDERKFYLCSANGEWETTGGKDFSHLSEVPVPVKEKLLEGEGYLFKSDTGCCPSNGCWDGNQCAQDQRNLPHSPSIAGFRCIEGNWTDADVKFNPEEESHGFCPDTSQCLVSPFGDPDDNNQPDKNPQCISNGQFIGRHFCENGNWTSRTKFVAHQFMQLAQNKQDFVVFCDNPRKALNNVEYQVQGIPVETLVEANTNNFCVLSYDETIIIGTTLNTKLETDDSILDLLGAPDCDNAFNQDRFVACGGGSFSSAWYNSEVQSLIYSAQGFALEEEESLGSTLKDLFNDIIKKVGGNTLDPFNVTFVNNLGRFDKLYVSRNGEKEIRGTVEGFSSKRLLIEYSNFKETTNICEFIESYNERFSDEKSRILCEEKPGRYYVLAEGSELTKINPDAIWNDLTSKLRVS